MPASVAGPSSQGPYDHSHDFILDSENLIVSTVEPVTPHMAAVAGIDELSSDANFIAHPAYTAFEYILHAEFLPYLHHIDIIRRWVQTAGCTFYEFRRVHPPISRIAEGAVP